MPHAPTQHKYAALDIETTGLDWNRDSITVAAIVTNEHELVLRGDDIKRGIEKFLTAGYTFVGHNFKFDWHFLTKAGINIPLEKWSHDTLLIEVAKATKVPGVFLEEYEEERIARNKELPPGKRYRNAKNYSLKVMAPYYLKVPAFWETPGDYDNDEYVLKDTRYTYELVGVLLKLMTSEEAAFYGQFLMPWARMLVEAEHRGIKLDMAALERHEQAAQKKVAELEPTLKVLFSEARARHYSNQLRELRADSVKKYKKFTTNKPYKRATKARYLDLYKKAEKKIKEFNFNSSAQLQWALKDVYGLDISSLTNEGKTSSGAAVLEKLAAHGSEHAAKLLEYREANKLLTAFFPSYRELEYNGKIHTSFNLNGTRTGRLSCSSPNLQQVPGALHELFIADEGRTLVCRDQSAVEARLIAHYTACPVLTEICNNNESIHDFNTKNIFFADVIPSNIPLNEIKTHYSKERAVSKTIGFALFYGAGKNRIKFAALSQGYNWDDTKCLNILQKFKYIYRDVYSFKVEIIDPLLTSGETIANLFRRPVKIPNAQDVYMKGFNRLVQGGASDLLLEGARRAYNAAREHNLDAFPLLFVHDEVVFSVKTSDLEKFKTILDHKLTDFPLAVPLVVEGTEGRAWAK